MKFSALKTNALFFIILAGFVIMAMVGWPLFDNSMKAKERTFYEKVFYTTFACQQKFATDSSLVNAMTNDSAAIRVAQQLIKKKIDSTFIANEIPLDYVYAVGRSGHPGSNEMEIKNESLVWAGKTLIWSSDHEYDSLLTVTKVRIANLGPPGPLKYYVKIWFPSKFKYFFRELLPLISLTVFTLVMLFFCFLILISIIKKQNRLAQIKNDFVNNMTHELKTPLFTISIASKMLAEQESIKTDKKQSSYVNSIQQETMRLSGLVDKVLETSVVEKKPVVAFSALDLHEVICSSVKRFDLIQQEKQATITCSFTAAKSRIQGNEADIETMIESLVDNAVKYSTPPARITIATKNIGNTVQLSVSDHGIGMDETTKQFIFERFFRASTGDLHQVKGYGIGLSLAKAIVEAHSGSIKVTSAVGKGSEFIVSLPLSV